MDRVRRRDDPEIVHQGSGAVDGLGPDAGRTPRQVLLPQIGDELLERLREGPFAQ